MKSMLKIIGILLLAVIVFASCSKNTDPADTDIFAGTFRGKIGYIDNEKNISQANGSVFVTKIDTRYDFRFSDGIPDLTGVQFEKKDANTLTSVGSDGTGLITINKDKLVIGFTRNGRTWTADCNR
ncbi:hypothetical protein FHW36_103516 [Chitinophaga polysaccharea]|uniref:Lipoprotein n=1 Tax=Chitinophaga polysaccharea TaxID=1293035 RepID=A0A561PUB5_9BACT|nr:hypothetical protein [Chitinophaga polysaccharea]TWF41712.1 hypothetical protein FHW36_103516 [Chitinophaga polysaccharea]